jgi:hypothetical protein
MGATQRDEMAHGTPVTQKSCVSRATEPIERLILDLYISSRYPGSDEV